MVARRTEAKQELVRFRGYLETRVEQGSLSPGTVTTYMVALVPFWKWLNGRKACRELDQQYLDSLTNEGKSNSLVATTAHAIKRYHRWKGEVVDLEYPAVEIAEPKYLTVDEVEVMLDECRTPFEIMVVRLLYDTATRISEAMNISLKDIDWENNIIDVTRKGGHTGKVVAHRDTMMAIADWLLSRKSDSEMLFIDKDQQQVRRLIAKLGKKAGLVVTPHMFRHARAIQMLMAGVEPWVVQQHLGHIDIRTTLNIYGKFLPEHLKEFIPEPFKKAKIHNLEVDYVE